jgi:hypothetical protein
LLELALQVFLLVMPTDPPLQDEQSGTLLAQESLHLCDGNTRLPSHLHRCNLSFLDPSPQGQRMQAQAFGNPPQIEATWLALFT